MSVNPMITLPENDWMTVQEFCDLLAAKKWTCRVLERDSETCLAGEERMPEDGIVYAYRSTKADLADFLALETEESLSAFADSHDGVANAVPIDATFLEESDSVMYCMAIYGEESTDSEFQIDMVAAFMEIEGAEMDM